MFPSCERLLRDVVVILGLVKFSTRDTFSSFSNSSSDVYARPENRLRKGIQSIGIMIVGTD
jgi:hypothetical protein